MYPVINLHHPISAVVASGSQKHAVGDLVVYGNAKYVFAYNGSNTGITAGHFVNPLTGCSGYSIVQSNATNATPIGVAVHSNVATGEYFWMCVGGHCPRLEVTSAMPAGTPVFAAANGTGTSSQPTALGTATINPNIGAIGLVLNSIANNSSGSVYLYPLY